MNLDQVKQFARAVGTHVESYSGQWAQCRCPLAPWTHDSGKDSHPSFAIRYGEGIESTFNCFTCEAGSLHSLIARLEFLGAKAPKYDLVTARRMWLDEESGDHSLIFTEEGAEQDLQVDRPWPEPFLGTFLKAWNVPMAMEYLTSRGVSADTARDLDIRWDLRRLAVAFPIRNWEGELVGLRGRYIHNGDGPRYHDYDYRGIRNRLPWMGEDYVNPDNPVVMVESVFDLASVWRVHTNVVAPLSVGLSQEKCLRMRNIYEIYTLFDNGVGGDKGRLKIDKYLGGRGAVITHLLPPKHRGDPGDMTVSELQDVLGERILSNADVQQESI